MTITAPTQSTIKRTKTNRLRAFAYLGWLIFLRDFRYRYRQAYLGVVWLFAPVLFTGITFIVVGKQFDLGAGETPIAYEAFAFAGVVLWQIFWDALIYPLRLARRVRTILREVLIPTESIVVASLIYSLFRALLYIPLITLVMLIYQASVGVGAPLVGAGVVVLVLLGVSIGMVLMPFSLVYLDIRYALPLFSPVLMWTAPIVYIKPDGGFLRTINELNPLTYLIGIPRDWLVASPQTDDLVFAAISFPVILALPAALWFCRWAMPIVVERLPALRR